MWFIYLTSSCSVGTDFLAHIQVLSAGFSPAGGRQVTVCVHTLMGGCFKTAATLPRKAFFSRRHGSWTPRAHIPFIRTLTASSVHCLERLLWAKCPPSTVNRGAACPPPEELTVWEMAGPQEHPLPGQCRGGMVCVGRGAWLGQPHLWRGTLLSLSPTELRGLLWAPLDLSR